MLKLRVLFAYRCHIQDSSFLTDLAGEDKNPIEFLATKDTQNKISSDVQIWSFQQVVDRPG